jgi:hypothetical protein
VGGLLQFVRNVPLSGWSTFLGMVLREGLLFHRHLAQGSEHVVNTPNLSTLTFNKFRVK